MKNSDLPLGGGQSGVRYGTLERVRNLDEDLPS